MKKESMRIWNNFVILFYAAAGSMVVAFVCMLKVKKPVNDIVIKRKELLDKSRALFIFFLNIIKS
jgi:hypothetical protein